jgi:hypothetical protein
MVISEQTSWLGILDYRVRTRLFIFTSSRYNSYYLLSSRLLRKNVKTRIYRTIVSPVILYECEALSLTLREEQRQRVSESRVL